MFTIGLIIGFVAGWFVNDKFDLIVDKIKSFRNKQFIMFGGIKLFFIGIVVTALLGAGAYVLKLRSDNAILQANQIKLEEAVSSQKALIENQKKDFNEILEANKKINQLVTNLKKDLDELDKRFNKNDRDIGKLAKEKPAVVERVINKGSDNAARCLELASGAALTKEELNATKKSEINPECPSLANPNYRPYQLFQCKRIKYL